jgi:CspA family cold shock protein
VSWGFRMAPNHGLTKLLPWHSERDNQVRHCATTWQNTRLRRLPMATGTVKWFNATKGYGFIQPDDGGNDAFVHITALEQSGIDSLNEGAKVSFDLEMGRNGKEAASNLRLIWSPVAVSTATAI